MRGACVWVLYILLKAMSDDEEDLEEPLTLRDQESCARAGWVEENICTLSPLKPFQTV